MISQKICCCVGIVGLVSFSTVAPAAIVLTTDPSTTTLAFSPFTLTADANQTGTGTSRVTIDLPAGIFESLPSNGGFNTDNASATNFMSDVTFSINNSDPISLTGLNLSRINAFDMVVMESLIISGSSVSYSVMSGDLITFSGGTVTFDRLGSETGDAVGPIDSDITIAAELTAGGASSPVLSGAAGETVSVSSLAVPEPSAVLLGGLSLLCLATQRRRA